MITMLVDSAAIENRAVLNNGSESSKASPWYVLHPYHKARCCWDLSILLLLIFSAARLPLVLCFHTKTSKALYAAVVAKESLYVCDVALYFFTGYDSGGGKIEYDLRKIASRYLRTWFLADVAAIVSYPLLFVHSREAPNRDEVGVIKLFQNFTIIRVLKFLKVCQFMKLNRVLSRLEFSFILRQHVMQIMQFAVGVLLICHCFACVFYALAAREKKSDGSFRDNTWIVVHGLDKFPEADGYVAALYWVVMTATTVGFGDIYAVSRIERVWSIVVMVMGASIFAIGTSWAIHLREQLQWKKRNFSTQMYQLDMFMDQHKIPDALRAEVRDDVVGRHSNTTSVLSVAEEHRILEMLNLDLRSKLTIELNFTFLRKIKFLARADELLVRAIAAKLNTAYYSAGTVVVRQGDEGDTMYFIVRGAVEVIVKSAIANKRVAVLTMNQFFGEGAIATNEDSVHKRNATVRAIMFTELRKISRQDMSDATDSCCSIMETPKRKPGLLGAPSTRKIIRSFSSKVGGGQGTTASFRIRDAMRRLIEKREAKNRAYRVSPTEAEGDDSGQAVAGGGRIPKNLLLESGKPPTATKSNIQRQRAPFLSFDSNPMVSRQELSPSPKKVGFALAALPPSSAAQATEGPVEYEASLPLSMEDDGVARQVRILTEEVAHLKEMQLETNSQLTRILEILGTTFTSKPVSFS